MIPPQWRLGSSNKLSSVRKTLSSAKKTLEDDQKKQAQTKKIIFGKNVRKYLLLLGTLGGMLRMSFLSILC
jgi:4-hydroxybenzoate polyprenyltransferase